MAPERDTMVICDNCGSDQAVQRAFVTLWNGNIVDLCKPCRVPVAELLDAIWLKSPQAPPGR